MISVPAVQPLPHCERHSHASSPEKPRPSAPLHRERDARLTDQSDPFGKLPAHHSRCHFLPFFFHEDCDEFECRETCTWEICGSEAGEDGMEDQESKMYSVCNFGEEVGGGKVGRDCHVRRLRFF